MDNYNDKDVAVNYYAKLVARRLSKKDMSQLCHEIIMSFFRSFRLGKLNIAAIDLSEVGIDGVSRLLTHRVAHTDIILCTGTRMALGVIKLDDLTEDEQLRIVNFLVKNEDRIMSLDPELTIKNTENDE